jgi:predicted small secreted protein
MSIVESILKIDNKRETVPLYIIKDKKQNIYVTGSHLVYDKDTNKTTMSRIFLH